MHISIRHIPHNRPFVLIRTKMLLDIISIFKQMELGDAFERISIVYANNKMLLGHEVFLSFLKTSV